MIGVARLIRRLAAALVLLVALAGGSAAYAQTMNPGCSPAGAQGSAPAGWQSYCWLNFAGYSDSIARSNDGQTLSFILTDGSTLRFNIRATGTTGQNAAYNAVRAPSWGGAAVGNTAFLGIPGNPILYSVTGGTRTTTISGITITPPAGASAVTAYSFVVADAESTNGGESLRFTTNGSKWQLLDEVPPTDNGSLYPAITGLRANPADKFRFEVAATNSGAVLASGTTSGTGNGPFPSTPVNLASGIALTLRESMAAGSVSTLARYHSTLTCIDTSTIPSSTPLPNNVVTTNYSLGTLRFGDTLQCTFTNGAHPLVRLRKALGTGGRKADGDQFQVRIMDGTTVVASSLTTGTGATITGGDTNLVQLQAGRAYALNEIAAGTTDLNGRRFAHRAAKLHDPLSRSRELTAGPVARGGHPDRQSGNRCGFAAQDARAQADRAHSWMSAQERAFAFIETAFGAGQNGGRGALRGKSVRRRIAAKLVCKEQRPFGRPTAEQGFEALWRGQHWQDGARALLRRFRDNRLGAVRVDPVGHAAAGQHRLNARRAQFSRLFEHEVEAVFLEQGGAQPQVGHSLQWPLMIGHLDCNRALVCRQHPAGPFAGRVVAQDHRIARLDPHHPRQIARLIAGEHNLRAQRQWFADKQARRAAGWPSGGCRHKPLLDERCIAR